MIAILLAAGVGHRLEPFTRDHPKCLLEVGGRDLLRRSLDALASCAVERAVVVVGYEADQVRAVLGDRPPLAVELVDNPDYREGSILSLWHARDFLGSDDVLVMDADVLYPRVLLERLVRSGHASCALLDGRVEGSGEEMILCAGGGRVWDIVRRRPGQELTPPPGVPPYEQFGESVGFLKLSAAHAAALAGILDERVRAGHRRDEYEATFPEIYRRCEVGYERVDDLPWTEIDFPADVERARATILPAIEALETGAA